MRAFLIIFFLCLSFTTRCFGMYGEDSEPSTNDSSYSRDRESPSSITTPEIETEMPESLDVMRGDENDPPEQEYVEKDIKDKFGFDNLSE